MAPDTEAVIRDGLALEADQRMVVANALLESLQGTETQSEIDESWRLEAAHRLAEIRDGSVGLVDADEHYDRLRASLSS